MSTLSSAVSGLKNAVNVAVSGNAKDKPVTPPKTDSKKSELEVLIDKDVASEGKLEKQAQSTFECFKEVVFEAQKLGVFDSKEKLSNLRKEIRHAFEVKNSKGYEKRLNILANCVLIINGGTKDDKVIKGQGWKFTKALFDNHTSGGLNEAFLKVLRDELPEGLGRIPDKAKRAERAAKKAAEDKAKQAGKVDSDGNAILTAETAYETHLLSIKMVLHFLQAGSDNAIITALGGIETALKYKLDCIRKGTHASGNEKDITGEATRVDDVRKVA